jgi:sugar phosphate isomerase/epimerase
MKCYNKINSLDKLERKIQMTNKKSIFTWFGYVLPMEQRFNMIKNAGFDHVMLWWGNDFEEIDGDRREHAALARKYKLEVENIHTPYNNANELWHDCLNGDQHQRLLLACIEDCAKFHIPTAVIHITAGDELPELNEIGYQRISQLVELAEKKEINLALENLRYPEYLSKIFSRVQSKRLGFCYDSGHENCYGKGQKLLDTYGEKLFAMHLHDNDGAWDQHMLPFEGNINWSHVMNKIKEIEYKGAISLEVDANNYEQAPELREKPEDYLARAYQAVSKLRELS